MRGCLFFKLERNALKKFDAIISMSKKDKEYLKKIGGKDEKIFVVENGVDVERFVFSSKFSYPKGVYFIGWFDNSQNVDALKHYFKEIHPLCNELLKDLKFTIIGRGADKCLLNLFKDNDCIYIPYLKEKELVRTLRDSILFVPLRFGGGTRLKILEAMSLGNIVISSVVGAEGLNLVDGEDVFIFKNPNEFYEKLLLVLNNSELRAKISVNARKKVVQFYSWPKIGEKLSNIYDKIISE